MEVDESQTQVCKFSRNDSNNKIGRRGGDQYQDEDEDEGDGRTGGGGGGGVGVGGVRAGIGGGGVGGFDIVSNDSSRLRAWHSSRIFRVSRASGGKDRHSKVLTAKGLRDRRVRLSVSTAIQFYDLQDRLGYDQPSKAVEWLIKAAADAISELPSLNTTFPDTPKQLSDEKRPSNNNASEPRFDMAEMELEAEPYQHQQHHNTLSKSASSTSETSKGSGLSLSRSEIRVKARERARERTAKDKEKDKQDDQPVSTQQNAAHHSSSFTDLLTGGPNNHSPSASAAQQNPSFSSFILKQQPRQVASTPMDHYFTSGLFGSGSSLRNHYPSGYSGQAAQYGNAPAHHTMTAPSPYNVSTDDHHHHHQELHQFSFLPDHMIPDASTAPGSDYDLNFTISSGMSGYNRGTLQSNSSQSPLPHHLQRFPSPAEGPNMPFFMGNVAAAAAASAAPPTENHYSSAGGFDGRLQLYYGDGDDRHSDLKGKGKN